ncbi:MAG: type I glutamate--ammonia ligase [Candidatus Eisenbacteria bacterium]
MFTTFEAAQSYIRENQIRMIDLKFTDLAGRWHHVTLPASQFDQELVKNGVAFDGSAVGLRPVKAGDMVLLPDLSTAFRDPFWDVPTLSFVCAAYEADDKQPFVRDPRNIAARAEDYMRELGIATESRWGPEYEFYVFDSVCFENRVNSASYTVESNEADWQSSRGGHGHLIPLHGGYHAIPPKDQLFNLRTEMVLVLESMGIEVKYHHHEVGGPGQCEIETPLLSMVRCGDVTQIVKYVTKMTAHRNHKTVTFMPKPLFGEAGNGMHFHQQLYKGDRNIFYDSGGYGKLSETAHFYIGGLLTHGPAVLAFTNPSTNSYRRLVPGYEAPVRAFFSLGNRNAAIRVPKYADQPDTARFEFRPPDATCNIYLALAAQLMAGIDGIRRKIDPSKAGFGPIDQSIVTWDEEQRKSIKPLPGSLREALDALERDNDFLLAGDVFDRGQIEEWIKVKREEYYGVRNRPHPFEMAMYFDV